MSIRKRSIVLIVMAVVFVYILLSLHITHVSEENVNRFLLIMVGTSFDPSDEQRIKSYDYTVEFQPATFGYIPIFANVQGSIIIDGKDLGHFIFTGKTLDSGVIPIHSVKNQTIDPSDDPEDGISFKNVSGWVFYMTPIPSMLQKHVGLFWEKVSAPFY